MKPQYSGCGVSPGSWLRAAPLCFNSGPTPLADADANLWRMALRL